ncbi:MAG: diacylglycerol/lipid kinase family protein [Candidatus Aminicenantales bacterium]
MKKNSGFSQSIWKEKPVLTPETSFIINPEAGQEKWHRKKRLKEHLKELYPGQIYDEKESKEKTVELAKRLSQNRKAVIAVGGDGTIADILQGIIEAKREKEVIFGILPFGSGNAFRKALNIPLNVRKALKTLLQGKTKRIDLIEIEGKIAGFASVGVIAELTHYQKQSRMPGFFGHFFQARKVFSLSKKIQDIELFDCMDDGGNHFELKKMKLNLLDCVIAKTNYFGYGWRIAPKAKIDDGYLDITFFEISAFEYLVYLPLIFFGLYQKTQKHFKAKKIVIKGKGLHIQYNGEYLGARDRVEARVKRAAIRVICPSY